MGLFSAFAGTTDTTLQGNDILRVTCNGDSLVTTQVTAKSVSLQCRPAKTPTPTNTPKPPTATNTPKLRQSIFTGSFESKTPFEPIGNKRSATAGLHFHRQDSVR